MVTRKKLIIANLRNKLILAKWKLMYPLDIMNM